MVPPRFPLRPRVFHQTLCCPHPMFSTPRDPVSRTLGPRPHILHLAIIRDFTIRGVTASRTRWLINGLRLERRRLRG